MLKPQDNISVLDLKLKTKYIVVSLALGTENKSIPWN